MLKQFTRNLLATALLAGAALAHAADPVNPAAAIKKDLQAKFPDAQSMVVTKLPYGNLYEAVADSEYVFYTDEKVSFILHGNLFDGKTQKNLTEVKMRELQKAQFDKLPLDSAIKVVKGNGKRVVAVFSDIDCPYCRRLEEEFAKITDVTIYTFMYPIDSLHPDAARKSRAVWCAPDRAKAWDELINKKAEPKNPGTCDNPVAKTVELGAKLGVRGTPALFFADGKRVPGMMPAEQLEKYLSGNGK
ncbi:MAG: DsbC family protein [Sulfuricella sp.]|nr:DsbC family protein [Sulfuricella sp.]